MPTLRRRGHARHGALPPEYLFVALLAGPDAPCLGDARRATAAELRTAWPQYRDVLLFVCVERYEPPEYAPWLWLEDAGPGCRPWAWWRLDDREPRRAIVPHPPVMPDPPGLQYGAPRMFQGSAVCDDRRTPYYESEADCLDRLNL